MRELNNGVAQFWRIDDDSLRTQADDKHPRHINRLDAETRCQPAIFTGRLNHFGATRSVPLCNAHAAAVDPQCEVNDIPPKGGSFGERLKAA